MGPNLTPSPWFGNGRHRRQQGPGAEQQLSLDTQVNRQGAQIMQELGWDERQMQGQARPTHLAGSTGRHGGGQSGDAEQLKAAAVAAGSVRPGCSQEARGGQAQRQEEEEQAASQGYEPTVSAGESESGRQEGGQSGDAEQSKAAAVAAGSVRPGCSQEARGGQAQRQEEEEQAASQGYEPTVSAGESEGGRQEGGQLGEAEQAKAAAVAAGSTGPGCSQEAGGGQARRQEEEEQAASQGYEPTVLAGENASGRPRDRWEEQAARESEAAEETANDNRDMLELMGDDEEEEARGEEEGGNEGQQAEAEWRGAMVRLLREGPREDSTRVERGPRGSFEERGWSKGELVQCSTARRRWEGRQPTIRPIRSS